MISFLITTTKLFYFSFSLRYLYFASLFYFSMSQIDKLINTLTQQVQTLEKAADEFRVANGLGLSKDENAAAADDDVKTGGGILV